MGMDSVIPRMVVCEGGTPSSQNRKQTCRRRKGNQRINRTVHHACVLFLIELEKHVALGCLLDFPGGTWDVFGNSLGVLWQLWDSFWLCVCILVTSLATLGRDFSPRGLFWDSLWSPLALFGFAWGASEHILGHLWASFCQLLAQSRRKMRFISIIRFLRENHTFCGSRQPRSTQLEPTWTPFSTKVGRKGQRESTQVAEPLKSSIPCDQNGYPNAFGQILSSLVGEAEGRVRGGLVVPAVAPGDCKAICRELCRMHATSGTPCAPQQAGGGGFRGSGRLRGGQDDTKEGQNDVTWAKRLQR